jgi:hypothetical protein
MARHLLTASGLGSPSAAPFVASLNARLATLTTQRLTAFCLEVTEKLPSTTRQFQAAIDYEDGGTALSAPFVVSVFEGTDQASLSSAVDAYFAANTGLFISPVVYKYTDQIPNVSTRFLAFFLTCTDAAAAAENYLVGGGGGGGEGGDVTESTVLVPGSSTARTLGTRFGADVNVKDYGAVGDGIANDTAAFQAAMAAIEAHMLAPASGQTIGFSTPTARLFIPAGKYLITSPAVLLSSGTVRGAGLVIEGQGNFATTIIFQPSGAVPVYLVDMNDASNTVGWAWTTFRNLGFLGKNAYANFWRSRSGGTIQSIAFEFVVFDNIPVGFTLVGTDTNSEWTFKNVTIVGTCTTFLYIPVADTSDQFLNFWFENIVFHTPGGCFIDAAKGGAFMINSGSFIHINPPSFNYFFKLRGTYHADATATFFARALRIEHRTNLSGLMYSEWENGEITFDDVDDGVFAFIVGAYETCRFNLGLSSPSIAFRSCGFQGYHTYGIGANAYKQQGQIVYDSCYFPQQYDPIGFVQFVINGGHTNIGGYPCVDFRSCRNKGAETDAQPNFFLNDHMRNWNRSMRGQTSKRVVSFKNIYSQSPYNDDALEVILPPFSLLVKASLYAPAGAFASTSGGTFEIRLKKSPYTPIVIATVTVANLSLGFAVNFDLNQFVNTDPEERSVKLVPVGISASAYNFFATVEYYA